ncbi:hypothetical protein M9H77_20840 [Catharanthus roseus]|uniref:Uncharacterized protein n=1 Tax=Catharanthus roseus TaxID=4058 RepID=A0ACC0AND9_CATRO|nr:hypothetical protein M9H77_20840 [Catharanthus roseus]
MDCKAYTINTRLQGPELLFLFKHRGKFSRQSLFKIQKERGDIRSQDSRTTKKLMLSGWENQMVSKWKGLELGGLVEGQNQGGWVNLGPPKSKSKRLQSSSLILNSQILPRLGIRLIAYVSENISIIEIQRETRNWYGMALLTVQFQGNVSRVARMDVAQLVRELQTSDDEVAVLTQTLQHYEVLSGQDPWLPIPYKFVPLSYIQYPAKNLRVDDFISHAPKRWNLQVLHYYFLPQDVYTILGIPLCQHPARSEDNQVPTTSIAEQGYAHSSCIAMKICYHISLIDGMSWMPSCLRNSSSSIVLLSSRMQGMESGWIRHSMGLDAAMEMEAAAQRIQLAQQDGMPFVIVETDTQQDFEIIIVKRKKKARCSYCHNLYAVAKKATTRSFFRHMKICVKRKIAIKAAGQQTRLNFLLADSVSPLILPIHSGKFEMEQMREAAAHWIMMHEHPLTILEEEGFNLIMKLGMPKWQKINKNTCKADCIKVYDIEKTKLRRILKVLVK